MSALFLADGVDTLLIGCNRLLTGRVGARPFVFMGAVGPVGIPAVPARAVRDAVACVTRRLGLKGLNSLDFLLDGERVSVIEVNPRPSATMELHDHRVDGGLVKAHLLACTQRRLPPEDAVAASQPRGTLVLYARRRLTMSRGTCERLQSLGWCHDIGRGGTRSGAGDPLCSISAAADSPAAVVALLTRRAADVETIYEGDHER
jgi:predicted ATP-grasp superfamily ATP-dependent carboligase